MGPRPLGELFATDVEHVVTVGVGSADVADDGQVAELLAQCPDAFAVDGRRRKRAGYDGDVVGRSVVPQLRRDAVGNGDELPRVAINGPRQRVVAQRAHDASRDDVRHAEHAPCKPRRLHAAPLVRVRERRAAKCARGTEHAAYRGELQALDIGEAHDQCLRLAGDETLAKATRGELTHQQFRLPFAAAEAAREIDVRDDAGGCCWVVANVGSPSSGGRGRRDACRRS